MGCNAPSTRLKHNLIFQKLQYDKIDDPLSGVIVVVELAGKKRWTLAPCEV